jgi:hypothetical protein
MDEILRLALLGALLVSFAGLAAYVLGLAFAVASTLWRARRPDPLADELDRLLAGLTSGAGDQGI